MNTKTLIGNLISLCKRRGFIYPSSEIYGGFSSTYDLGPLGALMAENIKKIWRKELVQKNKNIILFDGAIFAHPKTWEASGHIENFNDPLVEDKKTHKRYRADHILEEQLNIDTSNLSMKQMDELFKQHEIKSPEGNEFTNVKCFNLLMTAQIGCTTDDTNMAFLRGETCQIIFLQYKNLLNYMRGKLPFGVLQIGKAFRNEVTTKQFILRTREFQQLEFEFFVKEQESFDWYEFWKKFFKNILIQKLNFDETKIRYRKIPEEEMSHYAKEQYDLEIQTPDKKWIEISPLNHRGSWDLSRHEKYSKEDFHYFDPHTKEKYLPNIIETSFGLERIIYCILANSYYEEKIDNSNNKNETRLVLKLNNLIAPIKAAILPLMKKEKLNQKAQAIFVGLADEFMIQYDDSGSIGKRYRRHDEIGTPYCITIDYETLQNDSVTIRERDTMKQIRIDAKELKQWLKDKLLI